MPEPASSVLAMFGIAVGLGDWWRMLPRAFAAHASDLDSFNRRSAQFVQATAQLPKSHLVDRPNCITIVKLKLGHDAYPAIDPFGIPRDGRRDAPASCQPVGACRRQTSAVRTECEPVYPASMLQGWADR